MGKPRTIGLDIGTSCVRAIEFESSGPRGAGGHGTVTRIAEAPLPAGAMRDAEVIDPSIVSGVIKQMWASAGFTDKNVVVGVGNQRVVVRPLELPWMPMDQARKALAYQAAETLPMSVDEALLDYYPTGESTGPDGRTMSGLFVAAVKDTVSANVLAVEGAGLVPVVVDLNAFALLRSVVVGDLMQRTVACIDIGARVTTVVIAEAGVPRMVRVLAAGGQDATDAVARLMKVSQGEAEELKRRVGVGQRTTPDLDTAAEAVLGACRGLVESVVSTLSFYSSQTSGSGIDQLVLTGGGAHLTGLGQYLSSAARLPTVLGNSFKHATWARSAQRDLVRDRESFFALAMGLAQGDVA